MHHSIIIPHRNRSEYLPPCIWSIARSAAICGVTDWSCVVVDLGSDVTPEVPNDEHFALCRCWRQHNVFCKPLALNIGMDIATRYGHADVLTFIDGDAIVGKRWMENVDALFQDDAPTILSYRVRYLAPDRLGEFTVASDRDALVDGWFAKYHEYMRAFEAYRTPTNNHTHGSPVFGNSQFSIRTDVLGDLRWNEAFVGRGSEDLWMMRAIARKYGYDEKHPDNPFAYRGHIAQEPDHAMFHILQERYEPDWFPLGQDTKNFEKYRNS